MVNTAVDKMFYEFHKESLVRDSDGWDGRSDGGGASGKRLKDPEHVIKNTEKFMER